MELTKDHRKLLQQIRIKQEVRGRGWVRLQSKWMSYSNRHELALDLVRSGELTVNAFNGLVINKAG